MLYSKPIVCLHRCRDEWPGDKPPHYYPTFHPDGWRPYGAPSDDYIHRQPQSPTSPLPPIIVQSPVDNTDEELHQLEEERRRMADERRKIEVCTEGKKQ